ncbi:response regulator [Algoriphagus sp. AK58]|uniref:response regulator n=1 Tax=Algoriphagus sp. AK58 TaxID=1406877 RepID=UPI0016500D8B|nr:response regulator [Algoriphagus sp. AK58]
MKSKNVLIVDDNDLNRKLFENLIGQLYDFQSAHNGLEAVEMASHTPFDLILMDIQMPKMDGITAMKKIRESEFGSCPILAVTAFADEGDRQNFIDQGFDDFITKPIRPRDFILTVQSFFKKNLSQVIEAESPAREPLVLNKNTLNQLLKYNSKDAIKKVYHDLMLEFEEVLNEIEKNESKDRKGTLLEKIHTLKGNSGTLGAENVYNSAQTAESLGRQNKGIEFEDSLIKLKNDIIEFREFFNQETIFEL